MFEEFSDVRVLLTFQVSSNILLYEKFRLFIMEFIFRLLFCECTLLHHDRWWLYMHRLGYICSNCGHFENLYTWCLINFKNCTERWSRFVYKNWEICELIHLSLFTFFTTLSTTCVMFCSL